MPYGDRKLGWNATIPMTSILVHWYLATAPCLGLINYEATCCGIVLDIHMNMFWIYFISFIYIYKYRARFCFIETIPGHQICGIRFRRGRRFLIKCRQATIGYPISSLKKPVCQSNPCLSKHGDIFDFIIYVLCIWGTPSKVRIGKSDLAKDDDPFTLARGLIA